MNAAISVVTDAESRVRALIKRALDEQRYQDVAEVAAVADALASISKRVPTDRRSQSHGTPNGFPNARLDQFEADTETPSSPSTKRTAIAKKKDTYPRFERQGTTLVKVGWSKSDRKPYEHRAPKEAVLAFAMKVAKVGRGGIGFTMEDLLPVANEDGAEFPSYQAYLALAWLRQIGVVWRKGKDGYVILNDPFTEQDINRFWGHLEERG